MRHTIILLAFLTAACLPRNSHAQTAAATDRPRHLSDSALLDLVERQTVQYFWEGAEPNSGMAPERIHLDNNYPAHDQGIIATGGSGFGVMAIIAAIHRHYITREQGVARLEKIVPSWKRPIAFTAPGRTG